jgi:uncharacterized membrane protein
MSVTVIFAILPLIVVGAALWLVPSLSRRDQFFGVTVPPAFRRTRMARKILWCYRWWVTAQCALAWGALTFGLPAGTATADAVGPGGGVWAWLPFVWPLVGTLPALLGARNAIRPYAATPVPVGRVRVASLRQRPDALPGGVAAWSGPPVLLLLAAAFVAFHWSAIPVRFAVHWGIDGQPNGWANRSLPGVFQTVAVGLGVYLTMLFSVWQMGRQARGSAAMRVYTGRLLLAGSYLIACVFAGLTITLPFGASWGRPGILALVITSAIALFVAGAFVSGLRLRAAERVAAPDASAADARWLGGFVYFNPEDPAVFVEKRLGIGYTVNFARPSAWIYLVILVLFPAACLWIRSR